MGESIRCFMIRETRKTELFLRRYASNAGPHSNTRCPLPMGYHDACAFVRTAIDEEPRGTGPDAEFRKTDPRWPAQCGCGYVFAFEDQWQVNYNRVWAADDGREFVLMQGVGHLPVAPPGAMWRSDWLPGKGPDGLSLSVMTPEGEWAIDEGRWTRTGHPPAVTARPSIAIGQPVRYHAHLVDGVLVPV